MPESVALLAFSYDRDDELPGVYEELKALDGVFQGIADLCLPNTRWKVRQDDIEDAFRKLQQKIRIFHFSGHAGPSILQLNQDEFIPKLSFAEGLAAHIGGQAKGLKLVFLNGCATADQADLFLKQGIPAVIATTRPIKDTLAFNFATRFYREFTDRTAKPSLHKAFQQGLHSFTTAFGPLRDPLTGLIRPELLDERVRSSFVDDDEEEYNHGDPAAADTLYRLYIHPDYPDVANQTFEQWTQSSDADSPKPIATPKSGQMGKHEDGYLLCNRHKEEHAFSVVCRDKIQGQFPAPAFFFIHDDRLDAPQLLPERFRLFLLPKWCERDFQYETLQLPLPDDFGLGPIEDPNNPERDRFKIRLSEIYRERFGGTEAINQKLCALQSRPAAERLLVIHHEWQPGKWIDRAGQHTAEWQKRAQIMLQWYIHDYALDLQQAFSERLVIVITARYLKPDGFFPALFAQLAQDTPGNRVFDMPNLSPIALEDVDDWQDEFLGDASRTFLDPVSFFHSIQPDSDALPLLNIKDALVAEIKRYNQKYYGAS